ncbi:hypothetical protein, partial [Pseudomonas syringae]|uniref:hypothetical protein n=1 Tax=Pseudomonas syringae TaxID=317 RepID=UPI001F3BD3FB
APDIRLQTIIHFHLQTQDGLIRISLLCLATNLFVCRGFSFVAKEKAAALPPKADLPFPRTGVSTASG